MSFRGYSNGHPWYYKCGGPILGPKSIQLKHAFSQATGYMDYDIERVANMQEPNRTESLRKMKSSVLTLLDRDIRRYRVCAAAINKQRRDPNHDPDREICNSAESNMALKYSHLWNHFANLAHIENYLDVQPDLFDL